MALLVKNPPADAGDIGSSPESGRSPGGGHGKTLKYSFLNNPMDRGAWLATVHRVTKSQHDWRDLVCMHAYDSKVMLINLKARLQQYMN